MDRRGGGRLWAALLVVCIIAAAGPCKGHGRAWPGQASEHNSEASAQSLVSPVRVLLDALPSATAGVDHSSMAAGQLEAGLQALDSQSTRRLQVRCRGRYCNRVGLVSP
jgi:hypothetical protein